MVATRNRLELAPIISTTTSCCLLIILIFRNILAALENFLHTTQQQQVARHWESKHFALMNEPVASYSVLKEQYNAQCHAITKPL